MRAGEQHIIYSKLWWQISLKISKADCYDMDHPPLMTDSNAQTPVS